MSTNHTVPLVHGAFADGSSGKGVITEGAADAPNVTGLVHVAAIIPELGESLVIINARYPTTTPHVVCWQRPFSDTGDGQTQVELSTSTDRFAASARVCRSRWHG